MTMACDFVSISDIRDALVSGHPWLLKAATPDAARFFWEGV